MTDEEFVAHVEEHVHRSLFPPFGGRRFFNDELFAYVLDQAGDDITVIDQELEGLREQHGSDDHDFMVRIDNSVPSITIHVLTPTLCRELVITRGNIAAQDLARAD